MGSLFGNTGKPKTASAPLAAPAPELEKVAPADPITAEQNKRKATALTGYFAPKTYNKKTLLG